MSFGLKEEVIQKIRSVFASFPEIKEAILYGSRAKGNYKNGSDIDIVLKGRDLTLQKLLRINNQLDELSLPYTIDINSFDFISNKDLIDHIQRVGSVFYKNQ